MGIKLEISREKFGEMIGKMTTDQIIDCLVGYGIEFTELPSTPGGIYRREDGVDLVRLDRNGEWHWVDQLGDSPNNEIYWTHGANDNSWWVLVLDGDNNPIVDGPRILVDSNGNRLK